LLKTIKLRVGKRILNRKLRHFTRDREIHNFDTAKTAGILFTPTDQSSFEQIKHFLNYLGDYKIQIYVLGYIDAKIIPENFLFWKGINLFSHKELSWSMVPKSPLVVDFIDKPFDVLLDLSLDNTFPIEYISRLSKSKFKVGRFTDSHTSYDLMFDIEKEKKLDNYLEHIKTYLNLINKKNTKSKSRQSV
jgi:hypothetical protein